MTNFLALDRALLRWINLGMGRPWLDPFFVFVTEFRHFVLPAAIGAILLAVYGGRRGRAVLAALALCVLMTDQVSSHLLKPWIHRIRPCNVEMGLRLPHGSRGTLSFPSGHATNSAGAATVVALAYPSLAVPAILITAAAGLSRIYLGLHYPSDVLVGYFLGALLGWLSWRLLRRWAGDADNGPYFGYLGRRAAKDPRDLLYSFQAMEFALFALGPPEADDSYRKFSVGVFISWKRSLL